MSPKEDTIEIHPALLAYLEENHPNEAVTVRAGETVDAYALRCALEAGRQEIITKIKILDRHHQHAVQHEALKTVSVKSGPPPLARTTPIQR